MAWVRIDDQAPRNEKIMAAGPAACWLWVCGIAHAQSQLTDGFISRQALKMIGIPAGVVVKLADKLVAAGLFERAEGGFMVHDYLEYNPSRGQVLAKRAEDADRKRRSESDRTPRGIHPDSGGPCARVPSHPIPSDPIPSEQRAGLARPPALRTAGVFAGQLPRDHATHVACDTRFVWCVPAPVHGKLAEKLSPKHGGDRVAAGEALKAWYPTVWATLPDDFSMGDAFKFWQGRFDAAFASRDDRRDVGTKAVSAECPHDPPCENPGTWRCHQRTELEAARSAHSEAS